MALNYDAVLHKLVKEQTEVLRQILAAIEEVRSELASAGR